MMWVFLLLLIAHNEPVTLQDKTRLILRNGNNSCEGHIEIYYQGTWGYLGDKYWSTQTEEVVCRSTHCGNPVEHSAEPMVRPLNSTVWLNEVKCKGNERHLWDCDNPGWGVSVYQKDTVKKIKCSNQIEFSLDGFKCAGAVKYTTDGTTSGYICADNWGQKEASILCKNLECGESKAIPQDPWMGWKGSQNSKKMDIDCSGIGKPDNLWQCATQESSTCKNPVSVICTGYERFQLKPATSNVCSGELEIEEKDNWKPHINNTTTPDELCKQMHCGTNGNYSQGENGINLTCTDRVEVVLKDNGMNSTCYGAVHVKVNEKDYPVCGLKWTKRNAEVVCRELKCGDAIDIAVLNRQGVTEGIMDYVDCSGKESSLWHCWAKRSEAPFSCAASNTNAYVVCTGSIEVRLVDGPGRCAGRVEIKHEGKWKRVDETGWTDLNSDVVCRQLTCGNKVNLIISNEFSQGSGEFLAETVTCKSGASDISQCIRNTINQQKQKKPIGITCEEHKVVFLKGNKSCSGMVGIAHGNKTYWLSGSKETWNQESANTVCGQMKCGKASAYDFIPGADRQKDVWNESYNCSSTAKSLFECEKTTPPSNHSDTIASVTCSENIEVNLTNKCWGHVNICVGGKCGGVCADAWTEEKSVMLCETLGCGNTILPHIKPPPTGHKVLFQSLHTTKETTNLNQCNLVIYDKNYSPCNTTQAYVVCSGSVKPRFNSARDKCSGNVEMYFEGKWLPVCEKALKDPKTRHTICGELNCGQAVNVTAFGPQTSIVSVISNIECSANVKKSLTACNITSNSESCNPAVLQCSKWSKIALKDDMACSGRVYVHSKEGTIPVSIDGWTQTQGDRLCQDLQCGNITSNKTIREDSHTTTNFICKRVKNPESIWDCEKQTSSSQQRLVIECDDEPNVTLSGKCHGEVKIKNFGVCSNGWTDHYSHLVCQEQDCSNAIVGHFRGGDAKSGVKYYHVSCEDYHHKLGQCKRILGSCTGRVVSVYCRGNVKFNTTEKCGGQIEVNYRNRWEKVCPLNSFSPGCLDKLCVKLNCSGHNSSSKVISDGKKKENLETQLSCTENNKDINHCVIPESCKGSEPAVIHCNGYVTKPPMVDPPKPSYIVPIILGVGFLLLAVILILVFIRICIVKKAKNVSSRMLSRKDAEFESGDYDDVTSKANEMEDFGHGRFRSEAEMIMESDERSNASFSYDDIDEAAPARPLNSQAAAATAAGASRDNYILDQSTDGVTYEVDDPQENYDDIEASPEVTRTKAEVHDSSQTTPESVTVAPPGLVQGDEDYLVPGQDG